MFNFKNRNSSTDKAMKTMANICPFKDEDDFEEDEFSLNEDDSDSGWFFECKICQDSKCTGYIRK